MAIVFRNERGVALIDFYGTCDNYYIAHVCCETPSKLRSVVQNRWREMLRSALVRYCKQFQNSDGRF